jgi:hypothetical protein
MRDTNERAGAVLAVDGLSRNPGTGRILGLNDRA